MGSSASKATKAASKLPTAGTNAARKYPTRTPPTSTATRAGPGKTLEPTEKSGIRDGQLDNGAPTITSPSSSNLSSDFTSDPNLALNARLQSLGPVQPNPTQSNSSTFHSPTTSSFADPSLSASQFRPSQSNPMQTIFPRSENSSSKTGHAIDQSGLRPSSGSRLGSGSGSRGSTNPAVSLLTARYRLASEAENEFAQTGKSAAAAGRQFLDVTTLRQILVLRDEKGVEAGEIERVLGLKTGVVERLGRRGVVGVGS